MATSKVVPMKATRMKVAQVPKPGADFEIVEREIPKPGPRQVRIRVQACGVCHSDVLTKEGLWPGIEYPRIPGHEVAGVVDEVGEGVSEWTKGQRVGVGWHGGQRETQKNENERSKTFHRGGIEGYGAFELIVFTRSEVIVLISSTDLGEISTPSASPMRGRMSSMPFWT